MENHYTCLCLEAWRAFGLHDYNFWWRCGANQKSCMYTSAPFSHLGKLKTGCIYIYIHQYKRKSPEDECWSQTLFSTFFKKFHCKKLVWNTQLVLELPLLYFIEPLQSLVHAPGPPTTSTWRSPKGLAWHLRRSGRWEPNFDLVSPACFFLECVIGSIHIYIYTHMSMGAKQLMKLCWHHRVQYSTACLRGSLQPSATTNCHRKGYRSDM